ncbi:MAG: AAA family ATPase [bacterium]|nr:AAA family ATPase [bacterium]
MAPTTVPLETRSHEAAAAGAEVSAVEALPEGMIANLTLDGARREQLPDRIQTHISHLLLTKDRVYKIRKAVQFSFLSFATRAERNEDCLREVRLNRRLAPDVYLGVAPLHKRGDGWIVGEVGEDLATGVEAPEHCVVMRRLREGGDAQRLVECGTLGREHIDAIAECVAAFHEAHQLGRPAPWSAQAWRQRTEAPVIENLLLINERSPDSVLANRAAALLERCRAVLVEQEAALERRRVEGRAVDGHGDLQLAHVWFDRPDPIPSIIDCTEFNQDFRYIDAASEVAFLAMDLTYRDAPALAARFLARYAAAADDFGLYALVDYYAAYRSAVRAKVALLAALDGGISAAQRQAALQSAASHLDLAEAFLEPRAKSSITITCGSVGSGKSSAAAEFADACAGVVISSDRTRKRLAGLRADDHSQAAGPPREGMYSATRTDEVYRALLERAAPVIDSGRHVVLDASYSAQRHREQVRDWARDRGIETRLLEVVCGEAEARRRLATRERAGRDASDAGPDLLAFSIEHFEVPQQWPDAQRIVVATDTAEWRSSLRDSGNRIRSASNGKIP